LDAAVGNSSARYYSSGVISPDNTLLYAGSSLNVLDFVELMDETFALFNLNLSACWSASGLVPTAWAGDYGIVFAGTAVNATLVDSDGVGRRDHLFIGSGDGHLYALNTAFCTGFSMAHCKGELAAH
jgi:outer membrane protein assembly factor BamB